MGSVFLFVKSIHSAITEIQLQLNKVRLLHVLSMPNVPGSRQIRVPGKWNPACSAQLLCFNAVAVVIGLTVHR